MASKPRCDYGLLWRAIALSLLLHVVLLLQPGPAGTPVMPQTSARSVDATLTPNIEAAPQSAPIVAPASPAARMPAPLREPVGHEATQAAASAPAPAADETAAPTLATSVGAAGSGISSASVAEAATSPDIAEARKTYLFAIAAEARRIKKYPPRALAAGWTGTAEIQVVVSPGGIAQPPRLHKSSGFADIDNAALSLVASALARTPVPESLRGRNFDFVLPVSFIIND